MARSSRFGLINFPVPTNLTDVKGLTHMQMGIWAIIIIFVFYSFYKMFSSSSFSSSSFSSSSFGKIGKTDAQLKCEKDDSMMWSNGNCKLK